MNTRKKGILKTNGKRVCFHILYDAFLRGNRSFVKGGNVVCHFFSSKKCFRWFWSAGLHSWSPDALKFRCWDMWDFSLLKRFHHRCRSWEQIYFLHNQYCWICSWRNIKSNLRNWKMWNMCVLKYRCWVVCKFSFNESHTVKCGCFD